MTLLSRSASRADKEVSVKSDAELKTEVIAALARAFPAAKATAIGVAVKGGVVTLCGYLDSEADKHTAELVVRDVREARAIAVELGVRCSPEHDICDAEIADNAEHMIRWTTLDPDALRVMVEHGWVTLQGEAGCDSERYSVEKAIRPLPGVLGITNEIALPPVP